MTVFVCMHDLCSLKMCAGGCVETCVCVCVEMCVC